VQKENATTNNMVLLWVLFLVISWFRRFSRRLVSMFHTFRAGVCLFSVRLSVGSLGRVGALCVGWRDLCVCWVSFWSQWCGLADV
jgi:hypothetical protein